MNTKTLVLVEGRSGALVYWPVAQADLSRVVVCNAVMVNGKVERTGPYVPVLVTP